MKTLKSKYTPFIALALFVLALALTGQAQMPPPSQLTINSGVSIPAGSTTRMVWVLLDWSSQAPGDVPDTYNVVVVGNNPDGTFYATTPQIVPYDVAAKGFVFFKEIPNSVTNLQALATANKQIGAGIVPVRNPNIPQAKEDKL